MAPGLVWSGIVAAAHAASAETWLQDGVSVTRMRGGTNNALYRVEVDDQVYACKLCVVDERRRAAREFGSLRLLQAAGLDIAPEPIWLDESCALLPYPAVAYRWLPGSSIGPALTQPQLTALLDTYYCLHSLRPGDCAGFDLPDGIFHWFDFAPYVRELHDFLTRYGAWLAESLPDGSHLRDRLARVVARCEEAVLASHVNPGRDCVPLRLCRVDPNLRNALWCDDDRLRWVDWEYSGWGDPALDLAELRWHAALSGLTDAQGNWLRANYVRPPGDAGFDARLAVWDRILVTRWPLMILRWLWSVYHGQDRLRLTQPAADVKELRARLLGFIERAERLPDREDPMRYS